MGNQRTSEPQPKRTVDALGVSYFGSQDCADDCCDADTSFPSRDSAHGPTFLSCPHLLVLTWIEAHFGCGHAPKTPSRDRIDKAQRRCPSCRATLPNRAPRALVRRCGGRSRDRV